VFGRNTFHEHICLRSDYGRVDKTKEKESTDKRAESIVGGVGVFALKEKEKNKSSCRRG